MSSKIYYFIYFEKLEEQTSKYIFFLLSSFFLIFCMNEAQTQTSTETFETELHNTSNFTDMGVTFEIISHNGEFAVQGNHPGGGWSGNYDDNRFVDNLNSTSANVSFSIKTTSNLFRVNSFWAYHSKTDFNWTVDGSITIAGKLNGVTKFSQTKTTGFAQQSDSTNGFTFIDISDLNGQDYSNIVIDQLQITLGGEFQYMKLDTFNWVKDSNVISDPCSDLEADISHTNATCYGCTDGSVTISVIGGTPPYTYNWSVEGFTSHNLTGLPAGNYFCTITDNDNCETTRFVTITEPDPITDSRYSPISILSGFNADVIANGVGPSASSATDLDGVNFALVSRDFKLTESSNPLHYGLPIDRMIYSQVPSTSGLTYQLAPYSELNDLQIKSTNGSGTLIFASEIQAKKLFILGTGASGNPGIEISVNFSDGSSQLFSNLSLSDWFDGTIYAIRGIGRVHLLNDNLDSGSGNNPRLYQKELQLETVNHSKNIQSITVTKTSDGGVVNIFAITAEIRPAAEPDDNNILYVNQNVSGGNETGNSWENAIPELADALKYAKLNELDWTTENPLQIWVAAGTYKPMYSPADDNFGNPDGRNNTFLMVQNVKLFGGFYGGETNFEARDWQTNETILNGDIDNSPNDNSGNLIHVVVSVGDVGDASIDGFTISGANANLNEVLRVSSINLASVYGGGLFFYNSSPSVQNSIIKNNNAQRGGGMYNYNSSPSITNSYFLYNTAHTGGGIRNDYSSPYILNSSISENIASLGGGMFNDNESSPAFVYSTISNNYASFNGGGIYTYSSSPSFLNSTISNNTAQNVGGAICNFFSSASLINVKITDNTASEGGGIFNESNSLFLLLNVTISNNSANYNGGGIINKSSYLKVQNSIIYSNHSEYGIYNNIFNANYSAEITNSLIGDIDQDVDNGILNANPFFKDPENGDFSLQGCSPALNSGNNSLYEGLNETTIDLAGNPRLFGSTIDMGAYEFQAEQIDYSEVSFEDLTVTYNGNAHEIKVENLPQGTTVSYEITNEQNQTTSGNSATNSGIYQIKATISGCGEPQEFNAVLTIEKAQAVITADTTQTRTYNGTLQIVNASLSHAEAALTYTPQQGYTNAGTYIITVSAEETDNYLEVSKQITLIIENADWNPGGGSGVTLPDETYTYNGNPQSIEVENLPQNATVTYTITDSENNTETGNSTINAGTYSIHALVEIPNYNDIELTAELIINKAEAIITANEVQTQVYDGTIKNAIASLNHSETTLVYTPQQGYTDAGTFPITVSAIETQNYLAKSKEIELIIENADFEGIEFEDGEFTYDGIAHSIFVSNEPENAPVTYTNNGQINAGIYTVSALIQMPNYNDLTLTAELTINKAEAVITANEVQTHVYDGTIKNVVASLNHTEITLQYAPQQGYTDAGTYPITISAIETQNYLAVSKEIELIIENADFEGIEFEDGEFTYDGMEHSIFVSNEPENATVTYTNNGQINAGTYTVSALIQMPNYNDLTLTAELTINKAEAVITANEVQTHIYDGTIKNAVATLNHSETNLVYTPQQGYTNAGTYPITISAVQTQNYLAVSKEIELIIENADFEGIEFEDGKFTYDGISQSILVSNHPENATVTYTDNGQINAGTYTVSALIQMPNYNDLELTAELTIHKANQFITFNPIPIKHLENDMDFQLYAFASSGLEIDYTFTFNTENPPAIVSASGWVELLTSGSIWITAHQNGNENYNPAVSVERELEIISSDNSIKWIRIHGETTENPTNEIYYLIDCDDDSTSINIEIETEAGATVSPSHNFSVEIPKPGIYTQIITVTSQNGSVRNYELIIEKRFNFNDIVIQKFDNVLLVNNNSDNNGGYEFDAYRWYKNGTEVGTGQYYSAGDDSTDTLDSNAVYSVKMRTTQGEWLSSCESGIELRSAYSVKIAPNPVYSGNVIKVIVDFPEDELKNMQIKLYSMAGELILQTNSSKRITEIRLTDGMTSASYVIQINTGKTVKNIQFLVK